MGLKETLHEVVLAVLPVTIVILIIQFVLVPFPIELLIHFIGGAVMVMLGLALFLLGVNMGLLPVGELIGKALTLKGKLWIVLFFGFVIGFVVTVAEPDVQILAMQVDSVSDGEIAKNLLIATVALGVGIFVALSLARIIYNVPLIYLLLGGYLTVFLLSFFSSPIFIPVSLDAGGVTTGPMTVPFILSLGVGVSAVTKSRKGSNDTFGLVALASIGPILAVLIMGVVFK